MKKNVLIAFITFITLDLFAQIEKGKIIVSLDGNYLKKTSESGVTRNYNTVLGKYLSLNVSVGYLITDKFIAGIGLDYDWGHENRNNSLYIDDFIQKEFMDIKTKDFLPNLFLGYNYKIVKNLYINANVKFSYGKIKSDINNLIAGFNNLRADTFILNNGEKNNNFIIIDEKSLNVKYFRTRIYPELMFFINPEFCLSLGLGRIQYSMTDWKTENSDWVINFNPVYWNFGVKFKI